MFSFKKKPLTEAEKNQIAEQNATKACNSFNVILKKLRPYESSPDSWRLYQEDTAHAWEVVGAETDSTNSKLKDNHAALLAVREWLFNIHVKAENSASMTPRELMIKANEELQRGVLLEGGLEIERGEDSTVTELPQDTINALKMLIPNICYRDEYNALHGYTELSWELLLGSAVMFVNNFQQHLKSYPSHSTASALDQNINILKQAEAIAFSSKARTIRGQAIEATITKIAIYNSRNNSPLTPAVIAKMHSAKQKPSADDKSNYLQAAPLYLRQEMREELLNQWSIQDARYITENATTKLQTNAINLIRADRTIGIETPLFTPLLTEIQAAGTSTTPIKVMDTPRKPNQAAVAERVPGLGRTYTSATIASNTIEQLLTTHQGSPLKHYQILKALRSAADVHTEEDSGILNGYIGNLVDEIYLIRKATFTFMGEMAGMPTVTGPAPSTDEKHEAFCLLANYAEENKLPTNSSVYAALLYMLSTLDNHKFQALKRGITQESQPVIHHIFKGNASLRDAKEYYEQKITAEQRSRVMHDLLELYITDPKIVAPRLTSVFVTPTEPTQDEQDQRALDICVAFSATMMPSTLASPQVLEKERTQPSADRPNTADDTTTIIGSDATLMHSVDENTATTVDTTTADAATSPSVDERTATIVDTTTAEFIGDKLPMVALSELLQMAIRQTGTSANPLQGLTNLAATLMHQDNKEMLRHFLQQLANQIADSDASNVDENKRESAFTPLIELFVHVYRFAKHHYELPDLQKVEEKYQRILAMREDDIQILEQSKTPESISFNCYIPAAQKLVCRSYCALQFVNAAQNTMYLIDGNAKKAWLKLLCEQLNLVHEVYLPQTGMLITSYRDKGTKIYTASSQKRKQQHNTDCDNNMAEIARISDIAAHCAKQTARRWRSVYPHNKDLAKFAALALSPRDHDFLDVIDLIYASSYNNFIAAEAAIIEAVFSERFPRHNTAQEIGEYLAKPLAWLERRRADKTTLLALEAKLTALIGPNGARNIAPYIDLVNYFSNVPGTVSLQDERTLLDTAHLVASFIVNNATLFDGFTFEEPLTSKEELKNALNTAKIQRAATMPEIRERAFDQADTEGKTPLDKLSKQQLFDYIEGMILVGTVRGEPRVDTVDGRVPSATFAQLFTFSAVTGVNGGPVYDDSDNRQTFSNTGSAQVISVIRNVFYIWCYLTRYAEDLPELGKHFSNFMKATNLKWEEPHPLLELLGRHHKTTVIEKYLLGQAFIVMQQHQEHPDLGKPTQALIIALFKEMPISHSGEILNVDHLDHSTSISTIDNIARVIQLFLIGNLERTATCAENIKMLRNYMPGIDYVLTIAQQLSAQPINQEDSIEALKIRLQQLWEVLHFYLCTLLRINEDDSLESASDKIIAIFKELSQDESTGLQSMLEAYCHLTTIIKPKREINLKPRIVGEESVTNHCKALFIYLGRYADICEMLEQNVSDDTSALVTCLESSLAAPFPDYPRASKDVSNLSGMLTTVLEIEAKQLTIRQAYNALGQAVAVAQRQELNKDNIAQHVLTIQNALQTLENTLPNSHEEKGKVTDWLKKIHAVRGAAKSDELTQYYKALIGSINSGLGAMPMLLANTEQKKHAQQIRELLTTPQEVKAPEDGSKAMATTQKKPLPADRIIHHLLRTLEENPRNTEDDLQQAVEVAQILALTFLMVYPLLRPIPAAKSSTALLSSDDEQTLATCPGEYVQTLDQLRKVLAFPCKDQTKTEADKEHLVRKVLGNCHWLMLQAVTMSSDQQADQQDAQRLCDFGDRFYQLLPKDANTPQRYDRVLDALSWAAAQQEDNGREGKQTKAARFNLSHDTHARYIANQPLSAYQAYCLYDSKKAARHSDARNLIIEIYHAGYLAYLENEVKHHPVDVANILTNDRQLILRMRMTGDGNQFKVALNPQQRDNHSVLNMRLSQLLMSLTEELSKSHRESQNLMPFIMRAIDSVTDKSALIHVMHFMLLQQEINRTIKKMLSPGQKGERDRIEAIAKKIVSSRALGAAPEEAVPAPEEDLWSQTASKARTSLDKRLSTASTRSLQDADGLANQAVVKLKKAYPGAFAAEGNQRTSSDTITRPATCSISIFFKAKVASEVITPDCAPLVEAKQTLEQVKNRYKHSGKDASANLHLLSPIEPINGTLSPAEELSESINQVLAKYPAMREQKAYTFK